MAAQGGGRGWGGAHAHFVNSSGSTPAHFSAVIVRFKHKTSTSENKILNVVMGNGKHQSEATRALNNSTTLCTSAHHAMNHIDTNIHCYNLKRISTTPLCCVELFVGCKHLSPVSSAAVPGCCAGISVVITPISSVRPSVGAVAASTRVSQSRE